MAKARDIPGLHADLSYREAAARTVAVRAQELFEQAEDVLDTSDIERVHDMRVASRRLRAVLEIFAPCFPGSEFKGVLRDVKQLADALGERRDPDVHLEEFGKLRETLDVPDHAGVDLLLDDLRAEQARGNAILAAALEEARVTDLAGRLRALAAAEEEVPA
jgi:CHAD domain-containing protein